MLNLKEISALAQTYAPLIDLPVKGFDLRGTAFKFQKQASLMGVINLSSESWYRESVCLSTEQAVRRGIRLVAEGAAIVDIGAESTLTHASRVAEDLQSSRLVPVIRELVSKQILISCETYHPKVSEACLNAGASVLNITSSSGLNDHFKLAAKFHAGVIICYVEGENVRNVGNLTLEEDLIPKMMEYFSERVEAALQAGVTRIFIDPGLGFYYRNLQDSAQRVQHQMRIFLNTFRLRKLGWPICHALPHAFEYFEDEVRHAEGFFAVLALLGGTSLLRTHEVAKVQGVLRTMSCWN